MGKVKSNILCYFSIRVPEDGCVCINRFLDFYFISLDRFAHVRNDGRVLILMSRVERLRAFCDEQVSVDIPSRLISKNPVSKLLFIYPQAVLCRDGTCQSREVDMLLTRSGILENQLDSCQVK